MARRTVLATPCEDGHLALLEPVQLPPVGTQMPVILELPENPMQNVTKSALPVRHLGRCKRPINREEIYAE